MDTDVRLYVPYYKSPFSPDFRENKALSQMNVLGQAIVDVSRNVSVTVSSFLRLEIARQAAQMKLMRKLEKQALARAAKEARKQQGKLFFYVCLLFCCKCRLVPVIQVSQSL